MIVEPQRLFDFIRQEVPPPLPERLTEATDLRRDLRMAEEDADELLAKLFETFGVAAGDFDFTRNFPNEGLSLFGRRRSEPVALTLGMLLQAVEQGVWVTARIEGA